MAVRANAEYNPSDVAGFQANGDLSANQFHFTELQSDGEIGIANAATDHCEGILLNKPAAVGSIAEVMVTVGKRCKLLCDGNSVNITRGSKIGPNSSGHGVSKTTGKYHGIALEAVNSDGHIIPILFVGPTDV